MNQLGVVCHAPMFISELTSGSSEPVSLCGIVVDVNAAAATAGQPSRRPLIIKLDDGTGCLDCAYFKPDKDQLVPPPPIGASLLVNGVVNAYRQCVCRADGSFFCC
jgi:hypothetical protein